jgi:DNA-binding CsgD family transcriptional regulator
MNQTKLDDVLIETIRDEVKKGKYKIEVALELGLDYSTVKKYTKDIRTLLGIPVELEQRIRDEVDKGKSKRQVARELHVSRDTVQKYTRNLPRESFMWRKRSKEQIEQIQHTFRKCKSKTETAKRLGLTYWAVRWHTRDITVGHRISADVREKIRDEVKKGKTKTQVAEEMNLSLNIVSKYTLDISKIQKKADLSYNAFLLLKELMKEGYAFPTKQYGLREYQILREKIPNVCRVIKHERTIFFLEDKEAVAARAFIEDLRRKIISYKELKQVTRLFHTDLPQPEKEAFILKNRARKLFKNKGVQKERALREKDDSFSFICIRRYWGNETRTPAHVLYAHPDKSLFAVPWKLPWGQ